jgi:sterol desaturase/sphingolipid hydroxylase (fatty acid hydroxylase superfamily)
MNAGMSPPVKLNRGLYFGDFVASPIAIAVLTTVVLAHRDFEAAGLYGLTLLAGLGAWTLVEYAVHRWVYHRVPFFEKLHDAHHANPRALIGAPSFFSVGIVFVVFFTPLLFVSLVAASGFASGALLAYIAYMLVHHFSHHMEPRSGSLLCQARIRHMAHHYQKTPGNYGVTTSFWDWAFSTKLERPPRYPALDAAGRPERNVSASDFSTPLSRGADR